MLEPVAAGSSGIGVESGLVFVDIRREAFVAVVVVTGGKGKIVRIARTEDFPGTVVRGASSSRQGTISNIACERRTFDSLIEISW